MEVNQDKLVALLILASLVSGILIERYGTRRHELVQMYENHIQWQDSLINQLRTDKDSLRITRIEFDEAVKLLNEK